MKPSRSNLRTFGAIAAFCLVALLSAPVWAATPELECSANLAGPLTAEKQDRLIDCLRKLSKDDAGERLPEVLTALGEIKNIDEVVCRFFRKDPKTAAKIFTAYYFSNQENFLPICRTIDVQDSVPELKSYFTKLQQIQGTPSCPGSMVYGRYRLERNMRILAAVDPKPDFESFRRSREEREKNYDGSWPTFSNWALQGASEKKVSEELAGERERSRRALIDYYRKSFGLSANAAEAVSDYYLEQFLDIYVLSHIGSSSNLHYATLCYDGSDLDAYLRTGELPTRQCGYANFSDNSAPALLQRLLQIAIVENYPVSDIARLLAAGASAQAGITPQRQDFSKSAAESPLMLAAGRPEVVALLLERGANPNLKNGFGKTALMYAVQSGSLQSLRLLADAGADVNAATDPLPVDCSEYNLEAGQRTVLMYAAWQGTPEIIELLLARMPNIAAKDSVGLGAADYLQRNAKLDGSAKADFATRLQPL